MIKTKQKPAIVRIWQNINRNWGVAVGFLMLLFLIPLAALVNNQSIQNTTKTAADSSKPLVKIYPSKGQGSRQILTAEVNDENVDNLESVDLWWGAKPPSENESNGNFATVSIKNIGKEKNFDWRSQIYTKLTNGATTNYETLIPDDDANSNDAKTFSVPSPSSGEILLTSKNDTRAVSSVKLRKVFKNSASVLQFSLQTDFANNFSPKDLNVYMKAKRFAANGGTTSAIGNNEWTQVGTWSTKGALTGASVGTNQPPKLTSIPSSRASEGKLYKYEIGATDVENDKLSYAIYTSPKPKFLKLEGNILSGTPTASDVGPTSIVIIITDAVGNYTTQSWTINVAAAAPTAPQPPTITIISPKQGDKIAGEKNPIVWTVSPLDNVTDVRVSYAVQGSSSYNVIIIVDPKKTDYTWNSSNLADGTYIIKVEALDKDGKALSAATSAPFIINNKPIPTTTPTVPSSSVIPPRIFREAPVGTISDDRKPRISAYFQGGSADIDINTLNVTIKKNDEEAQDITSKISQKSADSFGYTPDQDLGNGTYIVEVTLGGKDAKAADGYARYKWAFTIDIPIAGTDTNDVTSEQAKIRLPILGLVDPWFGTIVIGLFVLLLFAILIFAIIMLLRILRGKDKDEMTQITRYYQNDQVPPAAALTTTTTTESIDPFAQSQSQNTSQTYSSQPDPGVVSTTSYETQDPFAQQTQSYNFDPNQYPPQTNQANYSTETQSTTTYTDYSQPAPSYTSDLSNNSASAYDYSQPMQSNNSATFGSTNGTEQQSIQGTDQAYVATTTTTQSDPFASYAPSTSSVPENTQYTTTTTTSSDPTQSPDGTYLYGSQNSNFPNANDAYSEAPAQKSYTSTETYAPQPSFDNSQNNYQPTQAPMDNNYGNPMSHPNYNADPNYQTTQTTYPENNYQADSPASTPNNYGYTDPSAPVNYNQTTTQTTSYNPDPGIKKGGSDEPYDPFK